MQLVALSAALSAILGLSSPVMAVNTSNDSSLPPMVQEMMNHADLSLDNYVYQDPTTHEIVKGQFGSEVQKRARVVVDINPDSLVQVVVQKGDQAFCRSFLSSLPKASTSTESVGPTTTATLQQTITVTIVQTTTQVDTTTVGVTSTFVKSTVVFTSTADPNGIPPHKARRQLAGRSPLTTPSYLKTYTAEQIRAVCVVVLQPQLVIVTLTSTKTVSQTGTTTIRPTTTQHALTTVFSTSVATAVLSTTTTTTICTAAAVSNVGSMGIGGTFVFPNAPSPFSCCSACFKKVGCDGWGYFAPTPGRAGICVHGLNGTPRRPPMNAMCPVGRGTISYGRGGSAGSVGGPGPCAA